jgi:hypothetical protein
MLAKPPGPSMDYNAPKRKYGDVESVFSTKHVQNLPENARSSSIASQYVEKYRQDPMYHIPLPKVVYNGTNSNEKNVWKSLNRMFEKPKTNINPKIMERAKNLVLRQLRPYLTVGLSYGFEFVEDTVPGCWWSYFGFRNKKEVLQQPEFYRSMWECRNGYRPYPPFKSAGKRELLHEDELKEGKIRTFLMAPMELLADEKFLYGKQDEMLKKYQPGFVRYGVNFHNGGFDRMIKNLCNGGHCFEWDVSGWDRQLSILQDVMEIRNKLLQESLPQDLWDSIEPIAKRVTDAICNHSLLLPDGVVVQWPWSQMSGDGETTSNNCIAHSIIAMYMLIRANPNASNEEILQQCINIYGDDILGSATEEFKQILNLDFVKKVYSEFGLTVKDKTFRVHPDPVGCSFLGATVRSFEIAGEQYFVPAYRKDRILSGLQVSCKPLDSDAELMKAYSLLDLGWYDAYDEISNYIKFLLKKCPSSPVHTSFKNSGIPSREEIVLRWAGAAGA